MIEQHVHFPITALAHTHPEMLFIHWLDWMKGGLGLCVAAIIRRVKKEHL